MIVNLCIAFSHYNKCIQQQICKKMRGADLCRCITNYMWYSGIRIQFYAEQNKSKPLLFQILFAYFWLRDAILHRNELNHQNIYYVLHFLSRLAHGNYVFIYT